MPALYVFGRRWRIGSDDFVIPGILEVILRGVWLTLTSVLFAKHLESQGTDDAVCKKGMLLLNIYLIGVLVILSVTILTSFVLVHHSARGTIMYPGARRHVPKILTLRLIIGIPEVGWNILGTVWLYSNRVDCNVKSPLWILTEVLVIFTWVALPVLIISVILLFEPMMRPERQEISSTRSSYILDKHGPIGSHYIKLWEKRCRLLCCTLAKDENSTEAFRNVADLFASIFRKSSLVGSDIAAALVLLRVKRKLEETQVDIEKSPDDPPNSQSPPPEWMNITNAHHFMKYALASYGWPWLVYGRVCRGAISIWKYLKCCGCCRVSGVDVKDNCCRSNIAAIQTITGLPMENIIYISFDNKIYEVPFFVAIDDESRHVVLSIRGTLSLHDAITDLNAQCTMLNCEGLPETSGAHKGIVQSAEFVWKRLHETRALSQAFIQRAGYGLVITGHSLGAGAAVVLAGMFRPQYPDLKCFSYSPPGGLCTQEFALSIKNHVMSVICGDDLVPRLSIDSIENLHNKISSVLLSCRKPKYRVLANGCWYCFFGISKASLHASCPVVSTSQDELITTEDGTCTYLNPEFGFHSKQDAIQDVNSAFDSDNSTSSRRTRTHLVLPGRIMYVRQRYDPLTENKYWEPHWDDGSSFSEIYISPNMLSHHLPQHVLQVLSTLVTSV